MITFRDEYYYALDRVKLTENCEHLRQNAPTVLLVSQLISLSPPRFLPLSKK
jgi:hypothetical protein